MYIQMYMVLRAPGIHNLLPQDANFNKQRIIRNHVIDKEIRWDIFDGASQEFYTKGAAGGIIFINETKFYIFYAGLGRDINNCA